MANLLLVRHSEPAWNHEDPPSKWELTQLGHQRSKLLGKYLAERKIGAIFSSAEVKAVQTAEIAGTVAGLTSVVEPDLREHERKDNTIVGAEVRTALIKDCLTRPDELIFGSETVSAARDRFGSAINRLMQGRDRHTVAIVAHGTVISAYLAHQLQTDPLPIWESLGLPGIVEVEWPEPTMILDQVNFE